MQVLTAAKNPPGSVVVLDDLLWCVKTVSDDSIELTRCVVGAKRKRLQFDLDQREDDRAALSKKLELCEDVSDAQTLAAALALHNGARTKLQAALAEDEKEDAAADLLTFVIPANQCVSLVATELGTRDAKEARVLYAVDQVPTRLEPEVTSTTGSDFDSEPQGGQELPSDWIPHDLAFTASGKLLVPTLHRNAIAVIDKDSFTVHRFFASPAPLFRILVRDFDQRIFGLEINPPRLWSFAAPGQSSSINPNKAFHIALPSSDDQPVFYGAISFSHSANRIYVQASPGFNSEVTNLRRICLRYEIEGNHFKFLDEARELRLLSWALCCLLEAGRWLVTYHVPSACEKRFHTTTNVMKHASCTTHWRFILTEDNRVLGFRIDNSGQASEWVVPPNFCPRAIAATSEPVGIFLRDDLSQFHVVALGFESGARVPKLVRLTKQ